MHVSQDNVEGTVEPDSDPGALKSKDDRGNVAVVSTKRASDKKEMLEHVLDALARGFAVFPLLPRGKAPLTAHGHKDASTDLDQIRAWCAATPDANVGLAVPLGVVVVDVDSAKGGDEALAKLEAVNDPLPATLTAQTGGGGWHRLYRLPDDCGELVQRSLVTNVDTRVGGRGYVVGAGSSHPDGGVYAWQDGCETMADCPAWVVGMLRASQPPKQRTRTSLMLIDPNSIPDAYVRRALEREVEQVANVSEGNRQAALYRASCSLGKYVGAGVLARGATTEALLDAAAASGVLADDGEAKCQRQVDRGFAFGAGNPLPDALTKTAASKQGD